MEITELKMVWNDDFERCYSLWRIDRKTVRIRGIFGRHLIAELFSPMMLRWEVVAFTTDPVLEHRKEHVGQAIAALLDEVMLILGDDG